MKLWDNEKSLGSNLKELVSLITIIGVIMGMLSSAFYFVFDDEIDAYRKALNTPTQIENLNQKIDNLTWIIEEMQVNQKRTFAIGLRVDADKNIWYRHTDGELHRAYPDPEYGWDDGVVIYVWYDDNGNKNYCY